MKIPRRYVPYILATLLLSGLVLMAQTTKPRIAPLRSASFAQQGGYFYLPPGSTEVSDVTQKDYETLLTEFHLKYFLPVFSSTQKPFVIPHEWANPYFAGFAFHQNDSFQVSLWGGMARAPGATVPILAAVLCHEVGHILGGDPKQTIPAVEWSSTEGQSDFFAAKECLPAYLETHKDMQINVTAEALEVCHANTLCARTVQVGLDLIQFFRKYDSSNPVDVSIKTPAPASPELLRNTYPSLQCRLDTYVQGALCQLSDICKAPACWTAEK